MTFKIESERTNLTTTANLEFTEWSERLDQLKSVTCFKDFDALLAQLQIELRLEEEQLVKITKCFGMKILFFILATYFRFMRLNRY
jgi:hypothetical protein